MSNFSTVSNVIWNSAGVLRFPFGERRYRDFILPFVVLRRFECVLEPTKQNVLQLYKSKGKEIESLLKNETGLDFYNISNFNLSELCKEPNTILEDMKNYINGFSSNIKEIFKKFKFDKLIDELHEGKKLFQLCNMYKDIDLSPNTISNVEMGTMFEDVLRRFNDQNPDGAHYTAPEVIKLLTRVLISSDNSSILKKGTIVNILDAACGTGGMLFGMKKEIAQVLPIKPEDISVYGQENTDETYAICCADMLIKGENPDHIVYGSTLQKDGAEGELMDFVIMNPPFGVEWGDKKSKEDYDAVVAANKKGTRFSHGLPPIDNGQLLFIQHGIDKLKPNGRAAIMSDNNPFSAGKAGSGNSEVRKWMVESDLLEACFKLPGKLFYNTGITTYFWVFNKNKPKERKNKILFVDASGDEFYSPMSKGLGDKHNELKDEHIEKVVKLYQEFKGQEHAKVLDINELLFDEVKTKRLFQRSYILNEETLEKIKLGTKFNDIVEKHSKDSFFASEANSVKDLLKLAENELKVLKEKLKKDESNENLKSEIEEKQKNCAHYKKLNDEIKSDSAIVMNQYKVLVSQEKELTKEEKQFVDTISLEIKKQENILSVLSKNFDDRKYLNRKSFEQKMNKLFPELLADKSSSALLKEMIDTCGEYDEEADIIKNEYDSEFNDSEILKHNENIDEYFEREVKPYSPTTVMVKDSLVVGCKIEWNKIFPKKIEEKNIKDILLELKENVKAMSDLEKEIDEFFKEIVE